MSDTAGLYEVVINPGDGYEKEHAELLRKRLLNDGFHDHVVKVRERADK